MRRSKSLSEWESEISYIASISPSHPETKSWETL